MCNNALVSKTLEQILIILDIVQDQQNIQYTTETQNNNFLISLLNVYLMVDMIFIH